MENSLSIHDLKLLLLQNKRFIMLVTFVIGIILGGVSVYSEFIKVEEVEQVEEELIQDTEYDINELVSTQRELLSDNELEIIYEELFENPYTFRVYIENQDGSVFERANLLREILLSSSTLENIQEMTESNIDFLNNYFLEVSLDSSNVLYNITVGFGNQQLNQEVSNALYEAIKNDEIDVLNNKEVKLFDRPEVVENLESIEEPVSDIETSGSYSAVIFASFMGLATGVVIASVIIIVRSFFSSTINPIFNYRLSEQDIYTNYTHYVSDYNKRIESLLHTVLYPIDNRKLVVVEDYDLMSIINERFESKKMYQSIAVKNVSEVDPAREFDEIVIITENNKTKKNWYANQKIELKTYNIPYKVIKV